MIDFCVKEIAIYTDGACKGNPGPGGWAAILIYADHEKIITGFEELTTNNRMELMAVINALEAIKYACKINLYTDSRYVHDGIVLWLSRWRKKNWRTAAGTKVKNIDLWERLDAAGKKHTIIWHWVKAHNGDVMNEKVDCLAKRAIVCAK